MEFTVSGEQAGRRLDVFLAEQWDEAESRSDAQRTIKAGGVSIDGRVISQVSAKLNEGQLVSVTSKSNVVAKTIIASNIPLTVAYEDDHIAVIDKPVGMTVHPGAGHTDDTLANGAVNRWPQIVGIGEADRPGIVHRLDRDTSGLMVIALTEQAYTKLSEMIFNREMTRIYTALVHGVPDSREGVIDAPIGRDPHNRTKQAIDENGRPSRTHYKVEFEIGDFSFLKVQLETGRMHQIRVHLNAIGHAVVGDQSYGKRASSMIKSLNRQFLHASKLEFAHLVTGEPLSIESKLPADLQHALDSLA
ncbi:MAG TPA: RluA family pseudouridine synthase [Dehalococcoidia bacterium]|jgi:23S rRNA pseudouridine1911/1915/1917 synthase|nr:RluA family pseudouridine synthase [Dehalococcoidia bacterium]HIK88451.1 RluA family pseudouridine synthase [Dehalococcoidia bacterium]